MKKLKLPDIAPYSGKRVQPFDGVKRYMSTGDLKGDNLSFEDVTYESKPSRADILVSEGDILFAKMTNTNKALQIDKELDGIIVSTGFSVHRPVENELFGEYFLHFLKHNSFQRQKNKLCTGAIQSAISNSGIERIFVPVPDYNDQIHIANLLSKAENLIAQRKESIRLLDEFLKSTFLEMFGDPEKNPKNLPFTTLEKLCSVIVDCPHSTPVKSKEATNYPCIRTSELTNGYISWDSMQYLDEDEYIKRTQRLIPEAGDIVYGREGTYGEAIRIPKTHKFSLGQRTMLFRPDYKKTNSIFLWAMVRSEFVYRQAKKKNSGSTVGHVNVKDIKQFRIFNPPTELQTKFAQIVEKTETLKTQYQQSLQELENLYGSLSQKAFRGELVSKKKEAKVIALTPEPKLVQPELNKQQAFLRKLMLASHIIHELCEEPTFGHTKLMKLLYLSEQAGGMALQTNYKKFAAGPFDGKTLTLIDQEFAKNKWFVIEKKTFSINGQQREATVYRKTDKSLLYKKHFDNYFESETDTINRIIELFRKEKTQTTEIVATLYFAWKELIIANTMISKNSLVKSFYQFHKEKKKFTEEQILLGYEYMLKNELYPQ